MGFTKNIEIKPPFIYGTAWKEDRTEELTRLAIENGFRAIDTANQRKHYYEAGVGDAVAGAIDEGLVDRSELFLQTKYTYPEGQDDRLPYDPDSSYENQVHQSLESSLDHLQTNYVDSLVLHGPRSRAGWSDADQSVWESMEQLLATDRVGTIGVSNVSSNQLKELLSTCDSTPEYVQNRCFARRAWDKEIRTICDEHDIVYQGFSLLTANQRELQKRDLHEIAEKYNKTIPQIIFSFSLQVGILPLTGTTSEQHMKQDLTCLEIQLSPEEIQTIEELAVV
ncbi:MAG: aldo/keto reductase family protein [bacterium]